MEFKICRNLEEAIGLLKELPQGRVFAGGTDIMPEINGNASPEGVAFVCISGIDSLKEVREMETEIEIGAMVTDAEIVASEEIKENAFAIWQAAYLSAGPQVRNLATVGGNIGTASPAGDVLCALLAFDADAVICSPRGFRRVNLKELITGPKKTSLGKDDIIVKVILKKLPSSFCKIGKRKAMTISIANCAATVLVENGCFKEVKIVAGSAGPVPVRCTAVEEALTGQEVSEKLIEEASFLAERSIRPITDQRATEWYRRQIVPVLVSRAVTAACQQGGWRA